jgi:hypothetical protein
MSILKEERLTLTQLAKELGVDVCTTWRWSTRGVRGVRLDSYAIGGKRYTTREALERFTAASTIAAGIAPPAPSAARFERDAEAAERELEQLGV